MISGIYQIQCLETEKVYIGSAVNSKLRLRKHKEALRRNAHDNKYLQRAWNKYGESNFTFQVIEIVPCKEDLIPREQFWLDTKKSANRKFGYNLCPTAGSLLGFKHSVESKLKVSKEYIVTDPSGTEINIKNLNAFCSENNLSQNNMSSVACGVIGQCKGWTCRYANTTKEDWQAMVTKKSKNKWWLQDPNGKEYWIRSKEIKDFCKSKNISIYSLHDISRGRRDNTKGWKAKFLNKVFQP